MSDAQERNPQPSERANKFSQLFEQAFDQQRSFWEQTVRYAREESLRFAALRLTRANQALENARGEDGFRKLALIQQGWLRDLVQDYASESVRSGEMMSRLAASTMARVADAGREAMAESQDGVHQAHAAASENLDAMHQAGAEVMHANHEVVIAATEPETLPSQEYH